MSIPVLFLIIAATGIGSKVFSKLCSNMLSENSVAKYSLVLIVNSLVACLFFAISGGFKIDVNTVTLLYSIAYAAIVAVSIIAGFVVYRYASISNVNVVSSSCSMVCTAAVGWIFFSEKVEVLNVIRLVIMVFAIVCVLFDQKNKETAIASPTERKKGNIFSLAVIIAVITACGCLNTVVLKAFSISKEVTDENSFFFFTNVILLIAALIVFAAVCLRKRGEFRASVELLRPKRLISIGGNTVCSNISSLVSVLIVARMDVSIYSPISSALGIIVGLVGSLIFRERLGVFAYIAVAVACVALII
ncbi:MAG: hypothetical protein E7607_06560 [Ruminococcaceae bacterium]|nr:hypothetical protein [Oscillospiraceae bacterium]